MPSTDFGDGIGYALYRRVIEIRDAQLALRPHVPPDLPGRVAQAVQILLRLCILAHTTEADDVAEILRLIHDLAREH